MRSQPVLIATALLCLAQTTLANNYTGAIQGFFNVTSLQTLLDDFAQVMPDFLARQSDFAFDVDLANGWVYDLKVNGIKLRQLDIGTRVFKIVPGSEHPSVHLELSQMSVIGHVTGGLELGPLQVFNFTELSVSNLLLRLELGVVHDATNPGGFWQVQGLSAIDFEDMTMQTDSIVLNTMFSMMHPLVVMYLRS